MSRRIDAHGTVEFELSVVELTDHSDARPGNDSRTAFIHRSMWSDPFDTHRRVSTYTAVGLSLLYASSYFLPATASGLYFMPAGGLIRLVVMPSLVAVGILSVAIFAASIGSRQRFNSRIAQGCVIVALTILTLTAFKGLSGAAGYDWEDRLPFGADLVTAQRHFKIAAFFLVIVLIILLRDMLSRLTRLLAGFGFAFAALAFARGLVFEWHQSPVADPGTQLAAVLAPQSANLPDLSSRRVVWVLFDETDFVTVYGAQNTGRASYPNFDRLASVSVFANNANSPASATLFSIPALLTGVPIDGFGIEIDKSGALRLQNRALGPVPLDNAHSIFGAIGRSGRQASILGFLHPYCRLFAVKRCDSFHWPEMGRIDSALWANVPNVLAHLLGRADTWETITQQSLELLPEYLARDDALTFVHLNMPHPPAGYADRTLHLVASPNPLVEYRHNLLFADGVLGRIMDQLTLQAERQDVLLVVSTDHWLRNMWFRAGVQDLSKPIPFMAWKVGAKEGIVLSDPLSTVNTASMIIDFLNGKIDTQTDIARWWRDKPTYPSFIVPNT